MLGQSLQSLLNTYSGKTPTVFSDRFPRTRTEYAPRVRSSLTCTKEDSYPLPHPCRFCRRLYPPPATHSTASPFAVQQPLRRNKPICYGAEGAEQESCPGIATLSMLMHGSAALPKSSDALAGTPRFGLF